MGNNYIYLLVPFLVVFSSLIFFPYIHFIIFSPSRDRERRKIRFVRAEIFSKPSLYHRGEAKSLEIKKQISWKLLATWGDRRGGKKIESGQRSSSLPRYFLTGVVRVKIERR